MHGVHEWIMSITPFEYFTCACHVVINEILMEPDYNDGKDCSNYTDWKIH